MVASKLISCWYNPAAFLRWSAASIFFVNLPVLDLPTKSGPIIISAFFKTCVTKYYRRPSLCGLYLDNGIASIGRPSSLLTSARCKNFKGIPLSNLSKRDKEEQMDGRKVLLESASEFTTIIPKVFIYRLFGPRNSPI